MCGICKTLVHEAGSDFHKLQGLLWKCGKLNFCKLRPFRPSDLLRKDLTSPRFPFAPSTERNEVESGTEGRRGKTKVSGAGGRKRNRLGERNGHLRVAVSFNRLR